jgi:hypothetical protein
MASFEDLTVENAVLLRIVLGKQVIVKSCLYYDVMSIMYNDVMSLQDAYMEKISYTFGRFQVYACS